MADALGTYGEHVLHQDFYQFDATGSGPLGAGWTFDSGTAIGTQTVNESDGIMALVSDNVDGETHGFGLNAVFSPASNGTLVLEARLKIVGITTAAAAIGFSTLTPATTNGWVDNGTLQSVTDMAALYFDSEVDADQWNEYIATNSGETQQNLVTEVLTTDEFQTFRVEIEQDGTVLMYIGDELNASGVGLGSLRLIAKRPQAVSTTALLYPAVYVMGHSGASITMEIDYFHFAATRNWAVD